MLAQFILLLLKRYDEKETADSKNTFVQTIYVLTKHGLYVSRKENTTSLNTNSK